MNPISPTRVVGGRYVVLGELGRGGMGVVWRAEDRVMGRQVAVKELHLPDGLAPQERLLFRERLLREARTAGRLNDPGIVTVYDVVTDGGVDHIVMELIEARTLDDVVATSGPLDEQAATEVARQLLAALRVAHDGGVVHRDVKPSNVMLASEGRVKLTDFGIAQAADDPRLTTTGSLVGSPGYMSPERLDGGAATPAADLWALGATLFHAVEGRGPFQRESTPATIAAVLHADAPPTRLRGPLGTVIGGLLQRAPQARLSGPQAAALLAAPGAPPDATAPTTPHTVRGVAHTTGLAAAPRRRWGLVAAAFAVGLVLGLVGTLLVATLLPGSGGPEVRTLTYGLDGDVPVYEVTSTYCLSITPTSGRQITSSATVSCDAPHEAEVFATFDTFAAQYDVPYPDGLEGFATSGCALRFGSGTVTGADKARLAVTALLPSAAEFGRSTASPGSSSPSFTERAVYCVLSAADGSQLTGTRLADTG